ncbi:hypothetical protein [Streptomyces sp. NPDC056188]|uniref:hypothetical protein n=1 Tax=Streptomyces sp. NPDC056188 TaxID=3345740 RepID=UPI0035DD6A45
MKFVRRAVATAAACAAALVAVTVSTHANAPHNTANMADSQPGYAVEDFSYPNADKIKAEKGIILKRGDGHITLADCSSADGLMEVWSRKNGRICFRTTGTSGYLTLEIPSVFVIRSSDDHTADVTLTVPNTKPQEVEVPKGDWEPVGESIDPQGREFVLVEIRTHN